MKIIAVANQKGGVGKTTTSVNLAAFVAEAGKRVLLIDCDPQGNASSALGIPGDHAPSLYEPLLGHQPLSHSVLPTRLDRLFLIAANLDLCGAEVEVARMEDHLLQLRKCLEPLRDDQTFDFVLLDCPPSLGILMTNALAAADEILVPIQCEYYALEGLSKLMGVMEQFRSSGINPDLTLSGMVMTMHDVRTNLSDAVVNDVRRHFEEVVFDTVVPRAVRLSEAPSFGKTILEYDPKGAGAEAYRSLAKEFLKRQKNGISFVNPQTTS